MDFLIEISNLIVYLHNYIGKPETELYSLFPINTNSKSKNYSLAQAMCFSYRGKGSYLALSEHESIKLKTIQLKENGKPKEAMSFSPINYLEIINEKWESSTFRKYVSSRFLFFVFQKKGDINYLKNVFMWKIPLEDLEGEVFQVWSTVRQCLIDGNVIKSIEHDGKIKTYFPAEANTKICHVRPHGANGADLKKIPVIDKKTGYKHMSKQSFWFNHSYLEKIINCLEK